MPGGATQPRKVFDAWQEFAKQRGARGLAYVTFLEDGTLGGPVAKNLSESERTACARRSAPRSATAPSSPPAPARGAGAARRDPAGDRPPARLMDDSRGSSSG
jgi:aspartyl-tRNA synthetase